MAVVAMRQGAVGFIQKPFLDRDLMDRLNQTLAKDCETRASLEEGMASHRETSSNADLGWVHPSSPRRLILRYCASRGQRARGADLTAQIGTAACAAVPIYDPLRPSLIARASN